MTTDNIISEQTIEDLYKQLEIEVDYSFSLEEMAQKYQETLTMVERESLNTTAYINR